MGAAYKQALPFQSSKPHQTHRGACFTPRHFVPLNSYPLLVMAAKRNPTRRQSWANHGSIDLRLSEKPRTSSAVTGNEQHLTSMGFFDIILRNARHETYVSWQILLIVVTLFSKCFPPFTTISPCSPCEPIALAWPCSTSADELEDADDSC